MIDKQFELASATWVLSQPKSSPSPEEVIQVMNLVLWDGFPEYTMISVETYLSRQESDLINKFEKALLIEVYVPGDSNATYRNVVRRRLRGIVTLRLNKLDNEPS